MKDGKGVFRVKRKGQVQFYGFNYYYGFRMKPAHLFRIF